MIVSLPKTQLSAVCSCFLIIFSFLYFSCGFSFHSSLFLPALGNGGVLLIDDSSTVTITNSRFVGNLAHNGNGGAIHIKSNGKLSIANSRFENNVADYGSVVASLPLRVLC
jgi:hypothetical protein